MDCPICGKMVEDVSTSPHPDHPMLIQCQGDTKHKFFIGTWAMGMDEDVINHVPDGFDSPIQAQWKFEEITIVKYTPIQFTPKLPELLPCPFCNGSAQYSECADYTKVFCTSCDVSGPESRVFPTESRKLKVTNRWNDRKTSKAKRTKNEN